MNVPQDQNSWNRWSLDNKVCVQDIQQAIATQYGIALSSYPLDPIPSEAVADWLSANQQVHSDFNSVLNLPGSDLEGVDFNDQRQLTSWIYLNWQELSTARSVLKI